MNDIEWGRTKGHLDDTSNCHWARRRWSCTGRYESTITATWLLAKTSYHHDTDRGTSRMRDVST
jgi:hypothetical protein